MTIVARLAELDITLPPAAPPVAAYVPTVEHAGMLYVSGQLPFRADGSLITGRLGVDYNVEQGREAAERCGIMLLAQLRLALGAADAQFTEQPKVANGASELMVAVFGEAGRHARSAVGVPVLPLGALVEVDAVVAVRLG